MLSLLWSVFLYCIGYQDGYSRSHIVDNDGNLEAMLGRFEYMLKERGLSASLFTSYKYATRKRKIFEHLPEIPKEG